MNSSIKSGFLKILTGFLYGLGVGVAVLLVVYFEDKLTTNFSKDLTEKDSKHIYHYDNSSLQIINHSIASKESDMVSIIGKILNDSKVFWTNIKIETEFYDANGNFLYECTENLDNTLKPSQEENFMVTYREFGCHIPFRDFSSYKIKVIDAYGIKYH